MKHVKRGEIWLVDLGMARKVRPVLALSIEYEDHEKAIVTYVVRTTSVRGTRFEVEHRARKTSSLESLTANPSTLIRSTILCVVLRPRPMKS